MSDDERAGFEIGGRFYPWADQMRLSDPILIREVTGLSYQEFLSSWQAVDENAEDEVEVDPAVLSGMIAVAVWQQHTEWSRAKAAKYVERLNFDDVTIIGGDKEEAAGDPPQTGVGNGGSTSGTSLTTPSASNNGQGSHSDPASPTGTGTPESVIGSPV